jgi:hypothetical protein
MLISLLLLLALPLAGIIGTIIAVARCTKEHRSVTSYA